MKKYGKGNYPSFWKVLAIVVVILVFNSMLKHASGLGKNNSAEKILTDYAAKNGYTLDDYPEDIKRMLVLNDETEEFVTQYPAKIVKFIPNGQDLTEFKSCTAPPLLMEWDIRWGYMKYDGNVFGLTGSAPTCLSMVSLFVLHDMSMTPVRMASLSKSIGLESQPEKLMTSGARSLGMNVVEIPRNNPRLREAVQEKGCAVIIMLKSQSLSQFVVVRDVDKDGNYLLNDPASKKRSDKAYSFADLNKDIKRIWKFSSATSE